MRFSVTVDQELSGIRNAYALTTEQISTYGIASGKRERGKWYRYSLKSDEERKILSVDLRKHLQLDKIHAPLPQFAFRYECTRLAHAVVDLYLGLPSVPSGLDQATSEGVVGLLIHLVLGIHALQV